jgi:hypothetical protein
MRIPKDVPLFVLFVIALCGTLIAAFSSRISPNSYPQLTLMIVLIVGASSLTMRDPSGGGLTSTGTLLYSVMYLFDPITALVIGGVGYTIGNTLSRGWVTWKAFINGSQIGLSVAFGAFVYNLLGGDPRSPDLGSQIIPTLLGPIAHQIANNFFVGFFFSRVRRMPFLRSWAGFQREILWTNLLGVPAAILIAVLYLRVHYLMASAFLFVMPFQLWAQRLYAARRDVYSRIVESLVRAGEFSQPSARGHARRVADLSVAIGREFGLIERQIESLEFAALLHDVGMIGLDDLVASGESSTGSSQWIDVHTRVGSEIVGELPRREIAEMVLNHHTPFSRSSGVSIGARIIALAEEVDSRLYGLFPYSEPQSFEAVLRFVVSGRGTVFDPRVVDAFQHMASADEGTGVVGTTAEETPPVAAEGSGQA